MDAKKLKCSRRCILTLKCENQLPPIQQSNWWHRLYEIMDKEANIPPEQRHEVLLDIFPEKVLDKIMSIFNIEEAECEQICECSRIFVETVKDSLDSMMISEFASHSDTNRSIKGVGALMKSSSSMKHEHNAHKHNPYKNFFRRTPEEAAIWRSPKAHTIVRKSLKAQAQIVTERIAEDFLEWLEQFKENEESPQLKQRRRTKVEARKSRICSTILSERAKEEKKLQQESKKKAALSKTDLMNMFEVGCNIEAATSLVVAVKEIPCVTNSIARKYHLPAISVRSRFVTNLHRDIIANHTKPKSVAFGRCLPNELKYKPPQIAYTYKDASHYQKRETEIGKRLFESIANLTAVQNYCHWLIDHPEVSPPKNLLDRYKRYMATKFRPQYSEPQIICKGGTEWSDNKIALPL